LAGRYGPSVELSLESYPVPQWKQALAQVVTMAKFFLIYVAASSFNPLVSFGFMTENEPMPELLQKMKDNKMYSCLMIFFTCNAVEGMLISTGAFEIYAGEQLIASKLETGNVAEPRIVIEKIDQILGITPGSDTFRNLGF